MISMELMSSGPGLRIFVGDLTAFDFLPKKARHYMNAMSRLCWSYLRVHCFGILRMTNCGLYNCDEKIVGLCLRDPSGGLKTGMTRHHVCPCFLITLSCIAFNFFEQVRIDLKEKCSYFQAFFDLVISKWETLFGALSRISFNIMFDDWL